MAEPMITELRKLSAIATDMALSSKLRQDAIKSIGQVGTHDALLALLELAACENSHAGDRKLALKQAEKLIR